MAALRSLKGAPGEYQENCNQNGGKSNKEAKCPVHMDKKCPYLSLYQKIIPRTLQFQDILASNPKEPVYEVSDYVYDDMMMFRYEMQTIFNKHKYIDEKKKEVFLLGSHPLSKTKGRQLKDLSV